MNCLLIKALLATGQLKSGQEYDFDFDHQFIETEKYDAKPTYKKFLGYSPDVAVINDVSVMQGICTIKWIFVVLQVNSHETL